MPFFLSKYLSPKLATKITNGVVVQLLVLLKVNLDAAYQLINWLSN